MAADRTPLDGHGQVPLIRAGDIGALVASLLPGLPAREPTNAIMLNEMLQECVLCLSVRQTDSGTAGPDGLFRADVRFTIPFASIVHANPHTMVSVPSQLPVLHLRKQLLDGMRECWKYRMMDAVCFEWRGQPAERTRERKLSVEGSCWLVACMYVGWEDADAAMSNRL